MPFSGLSWDEIRLHPKQLSKGTARTTTTTGIVLGRKFAQMLDKPNNRMIGSESYFVVDPFWVSFLFRV
jgi:hypothetical protein